MADTTLKLKVLLEAAGIKPTAAQLEKLNKKLQQTAGATGKVGAGLSNVSNQANKTKRNLEGVAQRSNRAGKDFSRMSQGMGGLVQAYATVAANVFALSSAFLVLRRTADLSSMMKSAEDYSNRFGVSVQRLTKLMQEASGGALSFADALPAINKAVSAGVGIEQMEKLTVAATKASQTFGGTTTEALNRFISASQRGRVEIIQTLGVVIKTEQAYKDYAASIGKTALELTAFDKQQAILNATIAESEKVFDGVTIDPNPFQQFLTTLVDLKDTIGTTITDFITPFINILNKSLPAALLVIFAILKSVAAKAFPLFTDAVSRATKAGVVSSKAVRAVQIKARTDRVNFLLESEQQVSTLTKKQQQNRLKLTVSYYDRQLKEAKAFEGKLFDIQGKAQKAQFFQFKNWLGRVAALRAKGTVMKGSEFLSDQAVTNLRNLTTVTAASSGVFKTAAQDQANFSNSMRVTSSRFNELASTISNATAKIRTSIASMKSAFLSGFAGTFAASSSGLLGFKTALLDTLRSWRILSREVLQGEKTIGRFFFNLGKVGGRTLGLVAGGLGAIAGGLVTLSIYAGLVKIAWDAINKKFETGFYKTKKLKEALNSFNEALDEITERSKNYASNVKFATRSNQEFIKSLEFMRGTIDSTLSAFTELDKEFSKTFNGAGILEFAETMKQLEKDTKFVQDRVSGANLSVVSFSGKFNIKGVDEVINRVEEADLTTENITEKFEDLGYTLTKFAENVGPKLSENFVSLNNLFQRSGIDKFESSVVTSIRSIDGLGNSADELINAFKVGDVTAFNEALQDIEDNKVLAEVFKSIAGSVRGLSEDLNALNAQIGASRALEDLNQRISNFTLGIDKLKNANVPNKEIVNFFLDAQQALDTLDKTGDKLGNFDEIAKKVLKGTDLSVLKEFFNIEGTENVKEALDEIKKGFAPFKAVIEDSINNQVRLKAIATQIQAIKLEEAKTDADRINNIRSLNALEQASALTRQQTAKNTIATLNSIIKKVEQQNNGQTEVTRRLRAQREELEVQVVSEELLLESIRNRKDDLREIIKIERESLKASEGIINARLQILKIDQKLSESIEDYLSFSKKIYESEKFNLRLKEQNLELDIIALQSANLTIEQKEKERAVLNARLDIIKAETRELERQQEARRAQEIEGTGTTIFTKTGIKATAHFFRRALEEEIPKLKSTFEILGKGLSNTLIETFDTAVDNLLEGGKDFAKTVREGLKASLRGVFGEALKTRIKETFIQGFENLPLFGPLLGTKEDPDTAAARVARETTKTFQDNLISKSNEQIRLLTIIAGESGQISMVGPLAPPAEPTMVQNLYNQQLPGVAGLQSTLEQTNTILGHPTEIASTSTEELNKSPEVVKNLGMLGTIIGLAQQDSKTAIVSAIITMTSQLIAASQAGAAASSGSGGGGWWSAIIGAFAGGAKNGAIVQGGLTNLKPLAMGDLVNRPTAALIGEGNNAEAVVPLPNNREIPVDMRGASGDTINIEQKFDFRNADSGSVAQLRSEARMIEDRTFNRVFAEINKGGKYAKISGRR